MKITLILTAITLINSGCCETKYVYRPVDLTSHIPHSISKDKRLTHKELECLSKQVKEKIVLLDNRRLTLRGILESTQKQD